MPNHDRETRYPNTSGSGSTEPKHHERKEQGLDWRPRQGGDQTRDERRRDAQARDVDHLEPPIDPEEREKIR
jgi:hypothetical protein